jgi:hypothetical protein
MVPSFVEHKREEFEMLKMEIKAFKEGGGRAVELKPSPKGGWQ